METYLTYLCECTQVTDAEGHLIKVQCGVTQTHSCAIVTHTHTHTQAVGVIAATDNSVYRTHRRRPRSCSFFIPFCATISSGKIIVLTLQVLFSSQWILISDTFSKICVFNEPPRTRRLGRISRHRSRIRKANVIKKISWSLSYSGSSFSITPRPCEFQPLNQPHPAAAYLAAAYLAAAHLAATYLTAILPFCSNIQFFSTSVYLCLIKSVVHRVLSNFYRWTCCYRVGQVGTSELQWWSRRRRGKYHYTASYPDTFFRNRVWIQWLPSMDTWHPVTHVYVCEWVFGSYCSSVQSAVTVFLHHKEAVTEWMKLLLDQHSDLLHCYIQ